MEEEPVTDKLRFAVAVCAVGRPESVSFTVKVDVPATVGVPEIVPLAAFNVSPVGSAPVVMLQPYGVVPPVAFITALYGVPCWPVGNVDVVMLSAAVPVTMILKAFVAVWAVGVVESVTFAVKLTEAAPVGVPEICPVDVFRVSPGGKTPVLMLQLYGVFPPVAAKVALYALPCCPLGKELVLMLTDAAATTTLSACVAVSAVGFVESVTFTVKLKVPEALGVPEIAPLEAFKLRPVGREPEVMLQE